MVRPESVFISLLTKEKNTDLTDTITSRFSRGTKRVKKNHPMLT